LVAPRFEAWGDRHGVCPLAISRHKLPLAAGRCGAQAPSQAEARRAAAPQIASQDVWNLEVAAPSKFYRVELRIGLALLVTRRALRWSFLCNCRQPMNAAPLAIASALLVLAASPHPAGPGVRSARLCDLGSGRLAAPAPHRLARAREREAASLCLHQGNPRRRVDRPGVSPKLERGAARGLEGWRVSLLQLL